MSTNNSTQGNETFTPSRTPPIPVHAVIALWFILLIWSLLGNLLVVSAVYCNQTLRTNMNYLIVNMAVSDLLVPLVAMPWFILEKMARQEWLVDGPLGEALCKLVPFFSHMSPFVSSISLVIIAFQRYMAVVYSSRRHVLSRKTRWIAISFPWIVAMVIFSPYFYTYRLTNENGYTKCDYSWAPAFDYETAELILISILFTMGFVIPLIVIIILYAILVYKIRQSLKNVSDSIEKERILSRRRKNRRIFNMLITIVVMFSICWCPYFILFLLSQSFPSFWSKDDDSIHTMQFAFWYMVYLLAAINPCIYFVFLRDFRRGLKGLCCKKTIIMEPTRPPGRNQGHTSIPHQSRRPRSGDINQSPTFRSPQRSIPLQSR